MDLDIAKIFGFLICFIFALSVHEWAHAYVAKLLGDSTAEDLGRLTLSPLPHIDPVGTILLPILGAVSNFPLLGWAKPVPVDPSRLKGDRRTGLMLISFAGPFSNLVLCFLSTGVFVFLSRINFDAIANGEFFAPLVKLSGQFALVNAILAFFNLIPLHPLDGADVLKGLLPNNREVLEKYDAFQGMGMYIFFGLFLLNGFSWIGVLAFGYLGLCQSGWQFFL